MRGTSIAVIGAGFSGTLLTLHLLRRCPPSASVILVERNSQFGRGLAYSTGNPNHLLNVPAAKMSAFGDRPLDFLSWLRAQQAGSGKSPTGGCFVSRHLYGSYVRHHLNQELRDGGERLHLIRGNADALQPSGNRIRVRLEGKPPVEADAAVLAVGHFPPEPPPVADRSFYASTLYRPDPWAADALADLAPDAPLLLIGTGLTMVDAVVSLLDAGHKGRITALSRRGLLPLRHLVTPDEGEEQRVAFPTSVVALLQVLRRESANRSARGGTWQQIVDQLRPFTQDVWQAMSLEDRRRFLRHLRPWWDIHRHRMAGPVADRIAAAQASGQLIVRAGRIRAFSVRGPLVDVRYSPRGGGALTTLTAARVVNCSGPGCDFDRIADPLIRNLLASGLARPDPLRLGLDVSGTCALRSCDGAIAPNLFAVGPVTKGAFWEISAVPDIRRQCEYLAGHLAGLVKPAGAASRAEAVRLRLVAVGGR